MARHSQPSLPAMIENLEQVERMVGGIWAVDRLRNFDLIHSGVPSIKVTTISKHKITPPFLHPTVFHDLQHPILHHLDLVPGGRGRLRELL